MALWGSWAQSLCVTSFSDQRKQPSVSLHDLHWVPVGRFKQLLIREGMNWETRERIKRSIGVRSCFPIKGYTQLDFALVYRYWNPFWWQKLTMICGPQRVDPRPVGSEGPWCWLLLTSPPAHQKIVQELITPSLQLNFSMSSPSGDRGLWGQEPTVSPFAWQSKETLFFYPKLCLQDLTQQWCTEKLSLLWRPKDNRADKTKVGLGMQEQKNQTLIILPSPVL